MSEDSHSERPRATDADDASSPFDLPPDGEATGDEDLSESPFELQAVEGLPFSKDSEEARAIRRVIERADSERANRPQD